MHLGERLGHVGALLHRRRGVLHRVEQLSHGGDVDAPVGGDKAIGRICLERLGERHEPLIKCVVERRHEVTHAADVLAVHGNDRGNHPQGRRKLAGYTSGQLACLLGRLRSGCVVVLADGSLDALHVLEDLRRLRLHLLGRPDGGKGSCREGDEQDGDNADDDVEPLSATGSPTRALATAYVVRAAVRRQIRLRNARRAHRTVPIGGILAVSVTNVIAIAIIIIRAVHAPPMVKRVYTPQRTRACFEFTSSL